MKMTKGTLSVCSYSNVVTPTCCFECVSVDPVVTQLLRRHVRKSGSKNVSKMANAYVGGACA